MSAVNDCHFTSIAKWGRDCGFVISEDTSWICAKREKTDSVFYAMFSENMKDTVNGIYKKIDVHDSQRYSQGEQTPCYHGKFDCPSLHSSFKADYIPNPILYLAMDEERKNGLEARLQVINDYRKFRQGCEKEFTDEHENNPCLSNDFYEYLAQKINQRYRLDPPIRSIDIEERGNSGVHFEVIDNRSAKEISESILGKIEVLHQYVYSNCNLFSSKYKLFRFVQDPTNTTADTLTTSAKKTIDEIQGQKDEIVKELKELYMRLFIPELDFEEPLLLSLGFRPCYKCLNGVVFEESIE